MIKGLRYKEVPKSSKQYFVVHFLIWNLHWSGYLSVFLFWDQNLILPLFDQVLSLYRMGPVFLKKWWPTWNSPKNEVFH